MLIPKNMSNKLGLKTNAVHKCTLEANGQMKTLRLETKVEGMRQSDENKKTGLIKQNYCSYQIL